MAEPKDSRNQETANRQARIRRFCLTVAAAVMLAAAAVTISAAADRESAKVKWVDDGDTIVLVDGRRVRYIGIDAPEIENTRYGTRAEPYGYQALKTNIALVRREQVVLEFDRDKIDQYGRTLAYVRLPGGPFVNRLMLEKGLAHFVFRKPNTRYDAEFVAAQRAAMRAGRGIWRDWKEAPGRWIGNRRSRRFHDPDCPFGQQVSARNRVYFDTRWEAFWMGYAPAKRCGPDE